MQSAGQPTSQIITTTTTTYFPITDNTLLCEETPLIDDQDQKYKTMLKVVDVYRYFSIGLAAISIVAIAVNTYFEEPNITLIASGVAITSISFMTISLIVSACLLKRIKQTNMDQHP